MSGEFYSSGMASSSAVSGDSPEHGGGGGSGGGSADGSGAPRAVARAACLNCRTAKRKCDGAMPVCGPCTKREIPAGSSEQDGGCYFVASKRGGPRYKGVKVADVPRVREEREQQDKDRRAAATAASALVAAAAAGQPAPAPTTTSSAARKKQKTGSETAQSKAEEQADDAHAARNGASRKRKAAGGNGASGHDGDEAEGISSSHSASSLSASASGSGSNGSEARSAGASSRTSASGSGNGNGMMSNGNGNDGKRAMHYHQANSTYQSQQQYVPPAGFTSNHSRSGGGSRGSGGGSRQGTAAPQGQPQQHHPQYPPVGVACQPGQAQPFAGATQGMYQPHQQQRAGQPQHSQQPHHDLSMSNLDLWQRIQAQAAAFAASNGQTYNPNEVQMYAQQGQAHGQQRMPPHLAPMLPPGVSHAQQQQQPMQHSLSHQSNSSHHSHHSQGQGQPMQAHTSQHGQQMQAQHSYHGQQPQQQAQGPSQQQQPQSQQQQSIESFNDMEARFRATQASACQPQAMPSEQQPQAQAQQMAPVQPMMTDMDKWLNFNMLDTFFNQMQTLPKAGTMGAWGDLDDEGVMSDLMSISPAATASDVAAVDGVDSEQEARTLLSQYYKYVYPLLGVMLSPGHLSTYAFHFSEGRPSALLSAIAACVAICCRKEEAHITLRSSARRQRRTTRNASASGPGSGTGGFNGYNGGGDEAGGSAASAGAVMQPPSASATREEIARYHCRQAEILLQRDREVLDAALAQQKQDGKQPQSASATSTSFSLSPTSARTSGRGTRGSVHANGAMSHPSTPSGDGGLLRGAGGGGGGAGAGSIDIELMQIEEAAARVLLAHYHYGAGPDATHRMAFDHARKAWMISTQFDLKRPPAQEAGAPAAADQADASASSAFNKADRCEWKRRVHWLSYTAATHLSCLGGFKPLKVTRNKMTDLDSRPFIEHDDAAFGVYIRGAQNVSRAYSNIYNLDSIRTEVTRIHEQKLPAAQADAALQAIANRRQKVLQDMIKLDAEVLNFTRFDPSWNRNEREFSLSDDPEHNLATGLRISGKLMTSGALVILHRTSAFGNARIFLEPQCGIPGAQALEDNYDSFFNTERIPGANGSSSSGTSPTASLAQSSNSRKQQDSNRLWYRTPKALDLADQHSSDDDDEDESKVITLNVPNIPTWRGSGPAPSGTGNTQAGESSQQGGAAPVGGIGEEGDVFADGPYDPALSFERCRFAAYTMWTTLPHVLGYLNPSRTDENWSDDELNTAPLLPPLSCCSYVLGAYAMLMQCLFVQLYGQDRTTAEMLRARAWQIEKALQRFVRHWSTLAEYRSEVATLLVANQSLVESKNDSSGVDLRSSTVPFQQQA